jgi:hypothetical protein
MRLISCGVAVAFAVVALAGCSPLGSQPPRSSESPIPPLETFSNEDTMKQVVDPAKAIVAVAALQDVSAGFGYEACNDQGEPPYRGRVDVGFRIAEDTEPDKYFEQLAQTIVQQGVGWYDGPPPGKNPFGTVIHTDTVMAIIGQNPVAKEDGYVHIFGECRNMDDHRDAAAVNVTDQVVQR